MSPENAVREYVVRAVTLICDNDEGIHSRLTAVAQEAVMNDMGTGAGLEDYAAMWHGRPSHSGYERWEYARVAGIAVRDELTEIITEHEDSLIRLMLLDVLDLQDVAMAEMFGDHYLPEPQDLGDPNPRLCAVGSATDTPCPNEVIGVLEDICADHRLRTGPIGD